MNKFIAVVKREYVQRVRTKLFIVMTVLGPVLLAAFTVVPALLIGMKTGETRVAIVDLTAGKRIYQPLRISMLKGSQAEPRPSVSERINANAKERAEQTGRAFSGSFRVEEANPVGRSLDDLKRELNGRIGRDELEGYLIIPSDIFTNEHAEASYYGRNVGDPFTREQISHFLNQVVDRQRLINAGVKESEVDSLSKQIDLQAYSVNEKGEQGGKDSGGGFVVVFITGFLIYMTILLYGQVILGAVIEEKETRIAEILFSSIRSSTLMFGKLIGVSLVALTQLGIWFLAFSALSAWGLPQIQMSENMPHLPPSFFLYFVLFFLVGYFLYASLYALVGSMVTTTQEGGQVAMPIIFLLIIAFYLSFVVMRSPNSPLAFWTSIFPFFSPITMIVRIVAQTPPLWQIALSLVVAVLTIIGVMWLAARVHRVGMLMYGKRVSIPEALRWVKQQ